MLRSTWYGVEETSDPKRWRSKEAKSALKAAMSETLANLWQATLSGRPGVALCLVELRGFEPLTPCMPSRECPYERSWSPSFAVLMAGSRLSRCGPPVTVVVPSDVLQTSSQVLHDDLIITSALRPVLSRRIALGPGRTMHRWTAAHRSGAMDRRPNVDQGPRRSAIR
jgi:hypothetical protein